MVLTRRSSTAASRTSCILPPANRTPARRSCAWIATWTQRAQVPYAESRASADAAEGVPEPVHADSEGLHGAASQPVVAARRPAVLADRIVRPLGARPPGGPANQGLHREQPREGRLGGARGGVPVVERQFAVESRDDSRLSKPGGLRHARGHCLAHL